MLKKHLLFGFVILFIALAGCASQEVVVGQAAGTQSDPIFGTVRSFMEITAKGVQLTCTEESTGILVHLIATSPDLFYRFTDGCSIDRVSDGEIIDYSCTPTPTETATSCPSAQGCAGLLCVGVTGGGGGAAKPPICKDDILDPGEECDDASNPSNPAAGGTCASPLVCNNACKCVQLPMTSCADSDFSGASQPQYGTFDTKKNGEASAVSAGNSIVRNDYCADANLNPLSTGQPGAWLIEYRCNKFQLLERFVVACPCIGGNGLCQK